MERYVSPVPRDDIFGDVVPSRYVAIRQPSLKISLDFLTLGMPADSAVPRHAINLPSRSQRQNAFSPDHPQNVGQYATCLTCPHLIVMVWPCGPRYEKLYTKSAIDAIYYTSVMLGYWKHADCGGAFVQRRLIRLSLFGHKNPIRKS
jgi:hypothetical protein